MPALKVYFDTGKTDVAKEFADQSKDIMAYLKDNPDAKAIISGYNDPTGNAAANAELSKNRAKGVAAALKAAGAADDRVVLEKPADTTTGAALSNAEARRVEVTIRK
jgi:outer membrane protein OmpA-like peptidoglycan-associated protein